jgi:hypothetical protein
LVVCALTAGVFGAVVPPGFAACSYPTLEIRPTTYRPGDTIAVFGEGFGTECHDQGGERPSGACWASEGGLGPPMTGIVLRIAASGSGEDGVVIAAGIGAGSDYLFLEHVTLPADLEPGRYTIRAWKQDWGIVSTDGVIRVDGTAPYDL